MYKNPTKTNLLGNPLIYLPSCHSTNSKAAEIMQNRPLDEGALIITDHQYSGRGQRGNSWETEAGQNYTFSLILKPVFLKLESSFFLNIVVSLGLTGFLNRFQKGFVIKWPNDIYYEGKKIAGILIENSIKGTDFQHCIAGIGLNINQRRFSNPKATSLSCITSEEYSLDGHLEELLQDIEDAYLLLKQGNYSELLSSYYASMMWLNEPHRFTSEFEFTGTITGINDFGQLTIKTESGVEAFNFKEVEFVE